MPNLFYGGTDFLHAQNFTSALSRFAAARNPAYDAIQHGWADIEHWLASPGVWPILLAWCLTFTLVTTLILMLGFGPVGVVAGSLAAGFQSWMYGGFTPAAGVFATLTSLAMLGLLMPAAVLVGILTASFVALVVWLSV